MFANNPNLLWIALVSLIFVFFYVFLAKHVGTMRVRHSIQAPAISGHPEFERALRVQMNTLEQALPFLVSLWLCALLGNALIAALLGMVFLLGRALYAQQYYRDPSRRGPGFLIGFLAMTLLWLGALLGVLRAFWVFYAPALSA